MAIYSKNQDGTLSYSGKKLIILAFSSILAAGFPILGPFMPKTEAELLSADLANEFNSQLAILQGNTLFPISAPHNPGGILTSQRMPVVVTAYSSTEDQTDSDPFITAAGTYVRDGIIANNLLPFGTKVRMPEIYEDKIFVVEDRMHSRKGNYHVDIWFSTHNEAENFGAKITYIEIVEI